MRVPLLACAGLAVCCALLCPGRASGSTVSHPLLNHPQSVPGFTGQTYFQATGGGKTLRTMVDYAVFDPQNRPDLTFLPYAGFAAASPDDYLYAYQIFNLDDSQQTVLFLSIGLEKQVFVHTMGRDLDFDPVQGIADRDAMGAYLGLDGAKYNFLSFEAELQPGEFSTVLLLASPYGPRDHSSYVLSGFGGTALGLLPSPVPTPSAAAGGLALLALGLWRLHRRC